MEQILAKVGTLTVTTEEVDAFLRGLGKRGAAYDNPEGRKVVLEQLINNKLLLLDAKRNLMEADPVFRAELARLKDNLLVSFATEKITSAVVATDADVEAYYNENIEKFETGESVNASHILVKTEEEALEILAKIKAGDITFEAAAAEFSSCPSKENGGNLGDFGRGQMVPEFDTAVFELNEGEITDVPVKTQFGYHLIKLISKTESTTAPLSEIKDKLKALVTEEKQAKAYESKINQLKIMYPVDLV